MGSPDFWRILIACVGFGLGGELVRRYRAFKTRRWERPAAQRNAGFWTDRRLYRAEATFCAVSLAMPFTAIILLTSADRPIWVATICLIAYAFSIYILMSALNMREPQ